MAMEKSVPWADSPFKLIETPAHKLGADAPGIFCANTMALAHNLLLRMLNTVYLQCEYVHDRKDVMDFLFYCKCWSRTLHHHHTSEETLFFPRIETEVIGKPGSMQTNVDQHDAFQHGLEDFVEWVEQCEKNGGEGYDGKQAKEKIDAFGPALEKHMHEEIDSLLALREYDPDGEKGKKLFLEMEAEVQKGLDPVSASP